MLMEHVRDNTLLPPTYSKGVNPIDTIFCTAGVEVSQAGYLPFGTGVGDHRPLFMDVTVASSLGVELTAPKKMAARRLRLLDPRVVKRYNTLLKSFYCRFSLSTKIAVLQNRAAGPLSEQEAASYEQLDAIRIQGM